MDLKNVENQPQSKVVDLTQFKKKKDVEREVARSRKPLYVDHHEGRISGRSDKRQAQQENNEHFGDRLTKIRSSIDRINQLMAEIKKLSANKN